MFKIDLTNKELQSRIHEESLQVSKNKTNNPRRQYAMDRGKIQKQYPKGSKDRDVQLRPNSRRKKKYNEV